MTSIVNVVFGTNRMDARKPRTNVLAYFKRRNPYRPNCIAHALAPSVLADEEYMFDNGKFGLVGLKGTVLVAGGKPPIYTKNSMTTRDTTNLHNGFDSGQAESTNQSVMVIFQNLQIGSAKIIGNRNNTGTGGGYELYFQSNLLRVTSEANTVNNTATIVPSGVVGNYKGVFLTHSSTTRQVYPLGGSVASVTLSGGRRMTSPLRNLNIGELGWGVAGFSHSVTLLQVAFWNSNVLSTADMNAAFANAVDRCSRNGFILAGS